MRSWSQPTGSPRRVLPELSSAVRATRGQVLATEPLAQLRYAQPHYARDGYDYWHQLPDGRLVIGGNRDAALATEETDVEETTELVQGRLEELVERLVGSRPEVSHRWAGIWGTTPDLVPLVGRVPGRENVWVAGGYSGHGNALGLRVRRPGRAGDPRRTAAGARDLRPGATVAAAHPAVRSRASPVGFGPCPASRIP